MSTFIVELHDTIAQLRADLARVTAERDEAHKKIREVEVENSRLRAALSGRTVSCICGGDVDRMRAVVEAADDFAGVCDADIHPAALPLKRRLLATLAALDGAR